MRRYIYAVLIIIGIFISGCAMLQPQHSVFYSHQTLKFSGLASGFGGSFWSSVRVEDKNYIFSLEDKEVLWWGNIGERFIPHTAQVQWISPAGRVFQQSTVFSGGSLGSNYMLARLRIKNNIPQDLQGDWRVKVFFKGELIDEKKFIIGKAIPQDEQTVLTPQITKELELDNANVIFLSDEKDIVVEPDGSYKTHIYRKIKILKKAGENYGEVFIPYYANIEEVTVNKAFTVTPSGEIVKATQSGVVSVFPGYPVYGNYVYLMISMPALETGAIIEYDVDIYSVISRLKGEYWFEENFSSFLPTLYKRFSLTVPVEKKPWIKTYNSLSKPEITTINLGKSEKYTWTIENQKAIKLEKYMPPFRDILPLLIVSSIASWQEIGEVWRDLFNKQLKVKDEIVQKCWDLADNVNSEKDKVYKIFDYVQKNIRYVAVSLGSTFFTPRDVNETFKDKYGDCKDQTALLVSMLRECGIKAYSALIRTSSQTDINYGGVNLGEIKYDMPSMGEFNHTIVVAEVKDNLICLDPTDKNTKFGEVGFYIQGNKALLIKDNQIEFIDLPILNLKDNTLKITHTIAIKDNFDIEGNYQFFYNGAKEQRNRGYFQSLVEPEKEKEFIKGILNKLISGAEVTDFDISDPFDLSKDFNIRVGYRKSNALLHVQDSLVFIPFSKYADNFSDLAADKERIYSIYIDENSCIDEYVKIKVSETLEFISIPEDEDVRSPLTDFSINYENDNEGANINIKSTFTKGLYSRNEYGKLKEFIKNLQFVLNQAILLVPRDKVSTKIQKVSEGKQTLERDSHLSANTYAEYYRFLYKTISAAVVKPIGLGCGVISATFTLKSDGTLEDVRVLGDSAEDSPLRDVVVRAIEDSAPFPPFPDEIKTEDRKTFTITLEFRNR